MRTSKESGAIDRPRDWMSRSRGVTASTSKFCSIFWQRRVNACDSTSSATNRASGNFRASKIEMIPVPAPGSSIRSRGLMRQKSARRRLSSVKRKPFPGWVMLTTPALRSEMLSRVTEVTLTFPHTLQAGAWVCRWGLRRQAWPCTQRKPCPMFFPSWYDEKPW